MIISGSDREWKIFTRNRSDAQETANVPDIYTKYHEHFAKKCV